jgi:hypothetical protein
MLQFRDKDMCSSEPLRSIGDGKLACAAAGCHDDRSRGSRGAGDDVLWKAR